jgi:hypothetical protein
MVCPISCSEFLVNFKNHGVRNNKRATKEHVKKKSIHKKLCSPISEAAITINGEIKRNP